MTSTMTPTVVEALDDAVLFGPLLSGTPPSPLLTQSTADGRYLQLSDTTPFSRTLLEDVNSSQAVETVTGGTRLGSVAKSVSDWNNALTNGWYMGSSAANAPNGSNSWFIGEVVAHNSLWITQLVWAFSTDSATNRLIYRRQMNNGVWEAWERLLWSQEEQDLRYFWRGNILGTVGQSGGVPTGAIIQSGSNANGSYTRLASGKQTCIRTLAASVPVGATAWSWTFPAAFAATPYINVRLVAGWSGERYDGVEALSTSSAQGYWHNNSGNTVSGTAVMKSEGRWF